MAIWRSLRVIMLITTPLIIMFALAESAPSQVLNGEVVHLRSRILQEDRILFISKPSSYAENTDTYPVLYLLDGESQFRVVSAMVDFLAENDRIPRILVIGIGSGSRAQRIRDLTPPSSAEIDNRFSPGNGGADAFLTFLSSELIPFVEKTYRTRPYRVLVGHSLGGLFAVHALIAAPKLFNAYIVVDPSLTWNKAASVAQAESFFAQTRELPVHLYLSAANDIGKISGGIRRLAAILDESAPVGFRWQFEWLKNDDHMSAPVRSVQNGLDAIFDGWYLTDPLELYNRGGLEAVHRHFRDGGRRYGYDRSTSPLTMSFVVAGLIRAGRLEEASKLLLHDPQAYPPPWNQLDLLARSYGDRGDAERAAHYYRLSLKENPQNEWAKRKLAEMGIKVENSSQKHQ